MVPGGPEATRGAIRALQFIGVDAIKVHRRLPRDSYFAAADEAKKLGIPLVGHIPIEVTPAEASDAGQATIEHTQTLFEGTFSATLQEAELPGAIEKWLASSEADALFADRRLLFPYWIREGLRVSRPRHARHTHNGDRQSDRGYRVDH